MLKEPSTQLGLYLAPSNEVSKLAKDAQRQIGALTMTICRVVAACQKWIRTILDKCSDTLTETISELDECNGTFEGSL